MNETIEIHTSCGSIFHERIDDLSNRQISGLIEQNPDNLAIPSLKQVLAHREAAREASAVAIEMSPAGRSAKAKASFAKIMPEAAAHLDLYARFQAHGDNLTDELAEEILTEWGADWPDVWAKLKLEVNY